MADGSYRILGGAPAPDAARVQQLAESLTPAPDFAAAEADRADQALARVVEAAGRKGQDCAEVVADIRARLSALAPQGLVPRTGLGGLFDSPGKRMKAFRAAFNSGSAALSGAMAGLGERTEAASRRLADLDTLADDLRGAISALTEQTAAARERLARETPDADGLADFRDRVAVLEGRLAASVRALPLVRALQNADGRVGEALAGASKAIEGWRADWKSHLGLDGKRPRKVRPRPEALIPARDKVVGALARIEAEQAAAAQRRREIADRLG